MPATYEKIATTTTSSLTGTITFNSIAASWTDLRLTIVTRSSSNPEFGMRFNSDTSSNHSETALKGNGSTASSTRTTNDNNIYLGEFTDTANVWGFYTADIFSYAGSTYKTVLTTSSGDENGSGLVTRKVGLYRSTSAITRIDLFGIVDNFAIGTTATLYGILKA